MPTLHPDDLSRRLGDHMRSWRESNGLTLEKAGERIGVDLQQWHRWESSYSDGRNPTLRSLLRIAEAMDTDLPQLMADLYWTDDEQSV